MKKLFRSKKALSPVVAAIILIAVTVAVSIAVAAWMGALTFGFMSGSEQVKIIGVQFTTEDSSEVIKLTLQNTGASAVVITAGKVNDETITSFTVSVGGQTVSDNTVDPGETAVVTITKDWDPGTSYNVGVVTKAGNVFTYYATAPSS